MNSNRAHPRAHDLSRFFPVSPRQPSRFTLGLFRGVALVLAGLFCAAPLVSARAEAYTIKTIAGTAGVRGWTDGTNGSASFFYPVGVALDASGNIFIGDSTSSRIREISHIGSNWVTTTIAGSVYGSLDGTNSGAKFEYPSGVAIDQSGNLYVADDASQTIRKVSPSGTNWVVTAIAGAANTPGSADGTNAAARFFHPYDITIDSSGNLYVADFSNCTIRAIAPVGTDWVVSTLVGTPGVKGSTDGPNGNGLLKFPGGVAVDDSGTIYVADTYNHTVRMVRQVGSDWVLSTIAGLAGNPGSADGTNTDARFYFPNRAVPDHYGHLFVTDYYNNTIRKMTLVGTNWVVTTIAGLAGARGSADGTGTFARFNGPEGIAVDAADNLFISDFSNYTIRMGTPPPPPTLAVTALNNQMILSWPTSGSNFLPQTTTSLFPGTFWTDVTNGVVISGNRFYLTNPIADPAGYFRLRKQ